MYMYMYLLRSVLIPCWSAVTDIRDERRYVYMYMGRRNIEDASISHQVLSEVAEYNFVGRRASLHGGC